jgi:hypothetical protein
MHFKKLLILPVIFISAFVSAQKVESIYVNLYTDSLKKGTYNYINIDGLLTDGKYMPLDTSHLIFWASDGKFHGNELWLDKNIEKQSVDIKVVLKDNPKLSKEFTMFIKKKPDDEVLLTKEEILKQKPAKKKIKKKKKTSNSS